MRDSVVLLLEGVSRRTGEAKQAFHGRAVQALAPVIRRASQDLSRKMTELVGMKGWSDAEKAILLAVSAGIPIAAGAILGGQDEEPTVSQSTTINMAPTEESTWPPKKWPPDEMPKQRDIDRAGIQFHPPGVLPEVTGGLTFYGEDGKKISSLAGELEKAASETKEAAAAVSAAWVARHMARDLVQGVRAKGKKLVSESSLFRFADPSLVAEKRLLALEKVKAQTAQAVAVKENIGAAIGRELRVGPRQTPKKPWHKQPLIRAGVVGLAASAPIAASAAMGRKSDVSVTYASPKKAGVEKGALFGFGDGPEQKALLMEQSAVSARRKAGEAKTPGKRDEFLAMAKSFDTGAASYRSKIGSDEDVYATAIRVAVGEFIEDWDKFASALAEDGRTILRSVEVETLVKAAVDMSSVLGYELDASDIVGTVEAPTLYKVSQAIKEALRAPTSVPIFKPGLLSRLFRGKKVKATQARIQETGSRIFHRKIRLEKGLTPGGSKVGPEKGLSGMEAGLIGAGIGVGGSMLLRGRDRGTRITKV